MTARSFMRHIGKQFVWSVFKRSHLGKVTPQEDKLPQITADDHIEEPVVEELQTMKIEQDTKDSTAKVVLEFFLMGNSDQNIQVAWEKAPIFEISHIDFFGDDRWIVKDNSMVHVLQVKHPMDQSLIETKSEHQRKRCIKPSSSCNKRSVEDFVIHSN